MRSMAIFLLAFSLSPSLQADQPPKKIATGSVDFAPIGDQKNIPERYRLEAHRFDYEMEAKQDLPISGVEVFQVRFPSP